MNNYHSNFYNILFGYIKYPILLYENQRKNDAFSMHVQFFLKINLDLLKS